MHVLFYGRFVAYTYVQQLNSCYCIIIVYIASYMSAHTFMGWDNFICAVKWQQCCGIVKDCILHYFSMYEFYVANVYLIF